MGPLIQRQQTTYWIFGQTVSKLSSIYSGKLDETSILAKLKLSIAIDSGEIPAGVSRKEGNFDQKLQNITKQ